MISFILGVVVGANLGLFIFAIFGANKSDKNR